MTIRIQRARHRRLQYERLTPSQIFKRMKLLAKKQGNCLIPNWLGLVLCNLFLFLLFGLMAAAIMLAQSPPGTRCSSTRGVILSFSSSGKTKAVTAAPLRTNRVYNESCFTFDSSCTKSMNLWCINGRCQCYNQLYYWNSTTSQCVLCPSSFYYNGTACDCLPGRYLIGPSFTTCGTVACLPRERRRFVQWDFQRGTKPTRRCVRARSCVSRPLVSSVTTASATVRTIISGI